MKYSYSTVIIPTLNEEGNIGNLIKILKSIYPGINIIVSDEGSTDNTQKIVNSFSDVKLLDRTNKMIKGLTASVIDGAKITKTENIIVMDADLQHPPGKVGDIINALRNHGLVIGTREEIKEPWAVHRKLLSKTATALARLRVKCKDPMSGFFGIKTELFKNILTKHEHKFEKTGYKVLFEILKYAPRNTRMTEINYNFAMRNKGESKIRSRHIFAFARSLFK